MNFNNKKALIEASLIAAIAWFFGIVTLYIPILTILMAILPVPFIILAIRHDIKYTVLSLIIASILIGATTSILYTGFVFIILGPTALIMGYYIKNQKQPYEVMGLGTAASALSIFLTIQIITAVAGVDFIGEMAKMTDAVLDHQLEMLGTMNINPIHAREALNYLMMVFPALIIVQSMLSVFINYYLVAAIMNRLKWKDCKFHSFSEFQLPRNIVTGSFVIVVLTMLTRYLENVQHTSLVANITIIFVVIFFLQGVTFISYLLRKTKINRYIRIMIIIVIVFISPLMTLVALIGLMSTLFNSKEKNKE
ncbi:MAG: YybS family protein [Clostridiaceae bacterium]|nr:YybS family protein [Clostridiaceae bacterium]